MTRCFGAGRILEFMRRNTLYAIVLLLAAIAIAGTLSVIRIWSLTGG